MVSWVRGRCIGKGSFGTVNLAFDKQDGAIFAVKTANEANQVQSLDNEIKILRSLSSPFIVGFLGDDVSFENSSTCRNLHMEYLPGGTVAHLASSTHRFDDLDEKMIRSFAFCIVSALKYIHSRGIVHCDVKGRNILIGPNSNSVKLADFGSAIDYATCGKTISPRGSPLWMAPEVIRGEYQGPESDVWSLGCTVIEMVTGKPAWEDNGVDTLSRIGFSNDLPELPTQLSELGQDFVKKCLRREWSQRWSCDQLLQHPFLSSVSPNLLANEMSPRCVLDRLSSEFEEDSDELESSISIFETIEASAKEKISKLATGGGVNWETDGWVEVRRCENCEQEQTEEVELGTSSVYSDSVWISRDRGRAEWGFRSSGGSDLHVNEFNGSTSCKVSRCGQVERSRGGGGLSCQYGSLKGKVAVEGCEPLVVGFYYYYHTYLCNLLLYLLGSMRILKYNNENSIFDYGFNLCM